MMKRILLGISLLLLTSTVHAQINVDASELDSQVHVIGWFSKTDTLEYQFSQVVGEIVNGDTTIIDGSGGDFRICVTDSTKKGYKMELVFTDVWKRDSLSIQGQLCLMASRMALGSKVLFSTDEWGCFQGVDNWKERYKMGFDVMKKLIDSSYFNHPELYARQPKEELIKKLKEQYNELVGTKEKMTELFAPLNLLFSFHGHVFPIGESTVEKDGRSCYYQVHAGALEDDEDSDEDEYQIYIELEEKNDDGSLTSYHYEYAYFEDGWPRSVLATVVEEQAGKKVITQQHIDWVTKTW